MQLHEWSVIARVCFTDGRQIFFANDAGIADGLLWPFCERLMIQFQPDIGEQARPAAVAVEKRVNLDGSVMQMRCLFDKVRPVLLPENEVVAEILHPVLDLKPGYTQVQIGRTRFSCPRPDVAEHLTMQIQHP